MRAAEIEQTHRRGAARPELAATRWRVTNDRPSTAREQRRALGRGLLDELEHPSVAFVGVSEDEHASDAQALVDTYGLFAG